MKLKVVSVSSNTNSFGLRNMIFFADNGQAYEAAGNYQNVKPKGTIIDLGEPDPACKHFVESALISLLGLELPRQLSNPQKRDTRGRP